MCLPPQVCNEQSGDLGASHHKSEMCEADAGANERDSTQVLCDLEGW